MGNEQGSEELNQKNKKDHECYMGYCYNVLNYKGIKTEGSEKQSKSSSEKLSEKTTETTEIVSNKSPILFEWNEGGNNVVITGSFVNWQIIYPMVKNDNGVHQLEIFLDPGAYQFKFIIDNHWRCSNAYPMIDDGNHNTNNIIDAIKFFSSSNTKPPKTKEKSSKSKNDFDCIIPKQSELNTESPAIPFYYIRSFNINHNTKQNNVGKRTYLNNNERDLLSENNSYKKILIVPHVNM